VSTEAPRAQCQPLHASAPSRAIRFLRFAGHLMPPLPRVTGVFNRILKPMLFRRVEGNVRAVVNGVTMDLDVNECVDGALYFYPHLYDREELAFLLRRLGRGAVFLDVGAHIGFYTLMVGKQRPDARLIAIEADPLNAARLAGHLELNAMIARAAIVNKGVSDRVEELRLGIQLRGNRSGNSFLHEHQGGVFVPCAPLLQLLQEARVDSVDAMKIDIEGFEFRVLQRFLTEAPRSLWPRAVVMEYFADHPNTGNAVQLLRSHGYDIVGRTKMNWLLAVP